MAFLQRDKSLPSLRMHRGHSYEQALDEQAARAQARTQLEISMFENKLEGKLEASRKGGFMWEYRTKKLGSLANLTPTAQQGIEDTGRSPERTRSRGTSRLLSRSQTRGRTPDARINELRYNASTLREALTERGLPCPRARAECLVYQYDYNQDGWLTPNEFRQVLKEAEGKEHLHDELRVAWTEVLKLTSALSEARTASESLHRPQQRMPTNKKSTRPASKVSHSYSTSVLPTVVSSVQVQSHTISMPAQKGQQGGSVMRPPMELGEMSMASFPETFVPSPALPSLRAAAPAPPMAARPAEPPAPVAPMAPQTTNLPGIKSLDPNKPFASQVRDLWLHQAKRVIDLFHEWDTNQDNVISFSEFQKAVGTLGVTDRADIDRLWRQMDMDGSGEIVYHELVSALDSQLSTTKATERALDPNNSKHGFRYNKHDAQDAYKAIERREEKMVYGQDVNAGNAQVAEAHFTQGYLRGDKGVGDKFVPKEHRVGHVAGLKGKIDGTDVSTVKEQLREAMVDLATMRVIDIFRAWDTDESVRVPPDLAAPMPARASRGQPDCRAGFCVWPTWMSSPLEQGTLSPGEFAKAMVSLGFDATTEEMDAIFDQFDPDQSGLIEYSELERALRPGHVPIRKPRGTGPSPTGKTPAELKELAAEKRRRAKEARRPQKGLKEAKARREARATSSSDSMTLNPLQPLGPQLRDVLLSQMKRAIDLFKEFDTDRSNTISMAEFTKAFKDMFKVKPRDAADLFKQLDADSSGELTYHELLDALDAHLAPDGESEQARDPNNKAGGFRYNSIDSRDAHVAIERKEADNGAYSQAIRMDQQTADKQISHDAHVKESALKEHRQSKVEGVTLDRKKNAMVSFANARVVDVFRSWDLDEDGAISRNEFGKAMVSLGYRASKAEMDKVFKKFDPDGSGVIEYSELRQVMKGSQ